MAYEFKKGDKVKVVYHDTHHRGKFGVVTGDQGESHRVSVELTCGTETRWLHTSLELVTPAAQAQPFNLCPKQLAVFNAATELREAQIKFTKALDALNNNQ